MSGPAPVLIDVDDGIGFVTLNRPHRKNAFTEEMGVGYLDALDNLVGDSAVAAIVVRGAEGSFCAGADLSVLDNLRPGTPAWPHHRDMTYPSRLPKLVAAAIGGPCVGIGVAIVAACDFRFAAPDAELGFPFARLGLVAEHGLQWTASRLIGWSATMRAMCSAASFGAADAHAAGLVDDLADDPASAAAAFLRLTCSTTSPRSIATIKRQMWDVPGQKLESAVRASLADVDRTVADPDLAEGLGALRQRRLPNFRPL